MQMFGDHKFDVMPYYSHTGGQVPAGFGPGTRLD